MSIFQIIAILFAAFMVYVVRLKGKRYKLRGLEMIAWYILWVSFAILALFPNILTGVTGVLNFGRVFDLLVVMSFMALSLLVIFLYFTVRELQMKLEKYVREEAISRGKK